MPASLMDIVGAALELVTLPFGTKKASDQQVLHAKEAYSDTDEARKLAELHKATHPDAEVPRVETS